MYGFLIHALRVGIVVALLIGLFGQVVVIPTTLADDADLYPALGYLVAPYATVGIVGVACVQCVLVATWVLLGMIRKGVLFTRRASGWVTAIICAGAVATVLSLGCAVHLFLMDVPRSVPSMTTFGALASALAASACGAGFTLLVVVLRRQLRKATTLRADLAEVI